jgi:hypothetical protein
MRKQRIELVVEAVHFLMKIVIVFFCSFYLLLKLHLTSSQDVLFVPGFILLIHHMDQHALTVAICHSQPLDHKCLLISVMHHLLQLLLDRISSSSHLSQLSPQPFHLGGLRAGLTWSELVTRCPASSGLVRSPLGASHL